MGNEDTSLDDYCVEIEAINCVWRKTVDRSEPLRVLRAAKIVVIMGVTIGVIGWAIGQAVLMTLKDRK
ncbi:MAG: hypothetical protein ACRCYP_03540 [Alphaproteobacteria bacterium]